MAAEGLTAGRGLRAGALVAVLTVVAVTAVYARSLGYGLFSDDFHWINGAHHFEIERLWRLDNRGHFFRPFIEVYFRAAVGVCGQSAGCFHALSLATHALTCVLTGMLAARLSGMRGVGLLAAVLAAVQPAPVEAAVWVSAVTEILVTAWFVATIWLDRVAHLTGRQDARWLSLVTFTACLLTHESSVVLLPMLVIASVVLTDGDRRRVRLRRWTPFAIALAAYLIISWIINSRNYVVTEGHYQAGMHIVRNILHALASLVVGRRDLVSLTVLGVALAWAALRGPARVRFYAIWTGVALIPFAPFHGNLPSRYLYLSATGMACLTAELLWWARSVVVRWRVGPVVWWLITLGVLLRCGTFAARNVRVLEKQRLPFDRYAAAVVAAHPSPPKASHLEVPPPPSAVKDSDVEALLRWTYADYDLTASISETSPQPSR